MSIPSSLTPLFSSGSSAAAGYQVSRSLRFNSADSAYLSRTPAVAGNRRIFTWAGWVKRVKDDASPVNIFAAGANNFRIAFGVGATAYLQVYEYNGSSYNFNKGSAASYRDFSAWYHIVVAIDTTNATADDRVKMYVNGSRITDLYTATNINPSPNLDTYVNSTSNTHYIGYLGSSALYLDSYLADIHFIDGQALTPSSFTEVSATTGQLIPKAYTGTYTGNSFWLKFSDNSAATATTLGKDSFLLGNNWTPNNLSVDTLGSSNYYNFLTASTGFQASPYDKFRAFDGSTATEAAANGSGSVTFAPYLGIAYSSSVEVWTVASCSYNFNSGASTGSTNSNSYTTIVSGSGSLTSLVLTRGGGAMLNALRIDGNILIATPPQDNDSLVDTPTSFGTDTYVGGEVRGNYATLNPLDKNSNLTLSNGNLDCVATSGAWKPGKATIGVAGQGKYYWEILIGPTLAVIGLATQATPNSDDRVPGDDATSYGYLQSGSKYNNNSQTSYGNTFTTADIIGIAFDAGGGKIWFSKNGTWQNSGDPANGTNAAFTGISTLLTYFPMFAFAGTGTSTFNTGQRAFAYTAPSGFKALCDTNLGAPLIAKPNQNFDIVTYTGNGGTQTLPNANSTPSTPLAFSPDFVWIKTRSASGYAHILQDTVRGAGKSLASQNTNVEVGNAGDFIGSFNSDGFSVNTTYLSGTAPETNGNGDTFVGWAWDAGTTTDPSNQAGSITSQVRANVSAGFSVVTYTGNNTAGATVGHGLGVAPALIINKQRSGANNWWTYHASLGATKYLVLDLDNAAGTANTVWNDTAPTSTVFTIGVTGVTNTNSATYVNYCFTPVVGYSAFGSYTGNGSADGPFVHLGFLPRWILFKKSSASQNWHLIDTARDPYNIAGNELYPDLDLQESGGYGNVSRIDVVSNGFKIRTSNDGYNGSAGTYIFAAFAQNPFQYSRAR